MGHRKRKNATRIILLYIVEYCKNNHRKREADDKTKCKFGTHSHMV